MTYNHQFKLHVASNLNYAQVTETSITYGPPHTLKLEAGKCISVSTGIKLFHCDKDGSVVVYPSKKYEQQLYFRENSYRPTDTNIISIEISNKTKDFIRIEKDDFLFTFKFVKDVCTQKKIVNIHTKHKKGNKFDFIEPLFDMPMLEHVSNNQTDMDEVNLTSADVAVAEADVAVAEADVAVAEKKAAVAEADVAVAKADVTVAEADVAVAEADVAVAEVDAAVAEVDAAVAEADVAVAEVDAAVVEKKAAVVEADVAVVEKEVAVVEKEVVVSKKATKKSVKSKRRVGV